MHTYENSLIDRREKRLKNVTFQSFLTHIGLHHTIVPMPLCPCQCARAILSYVNSTDTIHSVPRESCLSHRACAIILVPAIEPSCPCNCRLCARAILPVPSCLCQRAYDRAIVPCQRARAIVPVPTCLCQTLPPHDHAKC